MKPFTLEGLCDCGNKTLNDARGRYICNDCKAAHKRAVDFGLLNDRVKPGEEGKINKEYIRRYGHAYHKYRHLSREKRCQLARLEAATSIAELEANIEPQLCVCGYPAEDGTRKCKVCKLL